MIKWSLFFDALFSVKHAILFFNSPYKYPWDIYFLAMNAVRDVFDHSENKLFESR